MALAQLGSGRQLSAAFEYSAFTSHSVWGVHMQQETLNSYQIAASCVDNEPIGSGPLILRSSVSTALAGTRLTKLLGFTPVIT